MTRRTVWITLGVLLLAAGLGGWRWMGQRAATPPAAAAAAPAEVVLELAATDVARAATRELGLGLPVSGTLRAVSTALVKARVPGELQGLTVREGDRVRAGQVLARVEPAEYDARVRQAEQQASAARSQVDIARRQYDNNAALVNKGFISATALDASRASLEAAQANYRAAQAATEVARKAVADTLLRAPIDGLVSQRLAQPGERVVVETRVLEIVDPSRLELEAALPPADSVAVRVGQTAQLQIDGMAQPVSATVARINPVAQAGSRSVLAYLAVAPTPGLRQGLFAQGQLATGVQRALAVPLSAVRTDRPSPYVQVVRDGRVQYVAVEPGARGEVSGETWVAVGSVAEGDVVLRAATGALREGTRVKLPTAAPAKP